MNGEFLQVAYSSHRLHLVDPRAWNPRHPTGLFWCMSLSEVYKPKHLPCSSGGACSPAGSTAGSTTCSAACFLVRRSSVWSLTMARKPSRELAVVLSGPMPFSVPKSSLSIDINIADIYYEQHLQVPMLNGFRCPFLVNVENVEKQVREVLIIEGPILTAPSVLSAQRVSGLLPCKLYVRGSILYTYQYGHIHHDWDGDLPESAQLGHRSARRSVPVAWDMHGCPRTCEYRP